MTVDDAADLHLANAMTLEAWVNPTKNTSWRTAIMKEGAGDLACALYASGSAKPSAWANDEPAAWAPRPAPPAPALNTWTHLAATYDATTIRLYVNGTQVATAARTGSLLAGDGPLQPRRQHALGRVVRRPARRRPHLQQVLTAAQIQTDMNTPVS